MTVSTTTSRVEHTGNGSSTAFTVPFYFLANGDLKVYKAGTLQTLTTHYTVAGAGNPAGGTVTFLSAPAAGQSVVIFRDPAITQNTDYVPNDPFPAESHERALDRLTMISQRLSDQMSRALRSADGEVGTLLPIPSITTRRNKYLSFDTNGDPISTTFDIDAVQNASTSALASQTAAAASASAAASSASQAASSASQAASSASSVASQVAAVTPSVARFSGNGSTVAFTLPSTPGAEENTLVFIDGVYQQKDTYSVSGTTLTFSDAPPAGTDNIEVQIGPAVQIALANAVGVSYQPAGSGAVVTNVQSKLREFVSVKDFGAVGDGVANDTVAINAALASLISGGSLYVPAGNYRIQRGNGSLDADNIIVDSITIYGDGAASHFIGYNAAGAIPNNAGSQFYNIFQATGRTNITIRDMSFEGYCTPLSAFQCTNVTCENIIDNGLLNNTGAYLRDKGIYVHKCTTVKLIGGTFDNVSFAYYLSGDGTTRSKDCLALGTTFKQTAAAGAFTAPFPVGIYAYYADDVKVSACHFLDIYSSVDSGTTGTGMGYGIYEGDGACNNITIDGANTFRFNGKNLKQAIGIYINQAVEANIGPATFDVMINCTAMRIDAKVDNAIRNITGPVINFDATETAARGIYCLSSSTTNKCQCTITSPSIRGGGNAIRLEGPNWDYTVIDPNLYGQSEAQILLQGVSSTPIKSPKIIGGVLKSGQKNGVLYSGYVVSAVLQNVTILDGNLSNAAGDLGAAILQSSFSFGIITGGNYIGNTPYGGGLFTYGFQNSSNASGRIFKDIIGQDTFTGISDNNQYGRYATTAPVASIFDGSKGDFVKNVQLGAGGYPGWYCTLTRTPVLTADASSASTTVTVNSTSGLAAGDVVLICKDSNPYDSDYSDTTKWHNDTVASVTDGTRFVLTTGIPAGDGTYVAGTAVLRIARFKAAAAIEA